MRKYTTLVLLCTIFSFPTLAPAASPMKPGLWEITTQSDAMKNRPQERGQEPDGLTCRKTSAAVCSFHARMRTILHFEPVWRIAPPCSVFRKRTEPSRGNER